MPEDTPCPPTPDTPAPGLRRPRVCSREGCAAVATRLPVLLLRPPRKYGDGQLPTHLDLPVCEECAATISLRKLVTHQSWQRIAEGVRALGKVAPDFGRTSVATIPIDDSPFAVRYEPAARSGGDA